MLELLRGLRSFVSMVLVGTYFVLGSLALRLVVIPATWFFPRWRYPITSRYLKIMAGGIFALLTLGGAHFRRRGTIPTASPVVIIANHQSLVDILQVALMGQPLAPAYVTRTRYARWVPLVSATVRLLGCPLVDPEMDPRGALKVIRQSARELPHGLLIFPEGHRSRDGEVRPFRTAGLEVMLRARRVPVYLVVSDGGWRVAGFLDLLYRVHLIDYDSEVLGPFEIPEGTTRLSAFIDAMRQTITGRLAERRRRADLEGETEGLHPKGA
jgi:1-acyl-sn-glycerol-3-phosphate acyltransferase